MDWAGEEALVPELFYTLLTTHSLASGYNNTPDPRPQTGQCARLPPRRRWHLCGGGRQTTIALLFARNPITPRASP